MSAGHWLGIWLVVGMVSAFLLGVSVGAGLLLLRWMAHELSEREQ